MLPAPPDAITGMLTASLTLRVMSMAKPFLVPSLFMEVSRISPAPLRSPSRAQSTVWSVVAVRPPWTYTIHSPFSSSLVSMARTTHWLPNCPAISVISLGFSTAEVFRLTLSAPALMMACASSRVRMPPPTVKGMLMASATFFTSSVSVFLCSTVAVISRNTSSSAPSSTYRLASSTASPASRSPTKFTPFTVRPSLMSRQGIILFFSIGS